MNSSGAAEPQGQEAPTFELEQVDMYGRYMLTSRVEILFVLRSLQKHGCLATVYFDHGQSFFLTTILAVDDKEGGLSLDFGADGATNRAALKATRLVITTNLERVKIQFQLTGLQQSTFEGRPAFRAALPDTLLRLQRREYFRLDLPTSPPLQCLIPIAHDDGSSQVLDLRILDISGGGVGLMAPDAAAPHLPVDRVLADCRIALPEEGVLVTTLRVRTAIVVTTRGGRSFTRVGCEFVGLPGNRLTLIQRYITRIERERKARLTGVE